MEAWWAAMATPAQVFYGIAFVSTAVLLVQLALMFLGFGDFDADVDTDGIDGHDGGLGVLSIRSILAFLTGFGWSGALAYTSGLGLAASVLIALVVGGLAMSTVVVLMRFLYGLGEEGTLDYANAIGRVGSVYLPIPPAMAGVGQVEVQVQGRLRTVRAFTRGTERLENRQPVKVVGVVDQQTVLVLGLDASEEEASANSASASEKVKEG